jgi:uncharacterized protein involved in response to NO
VASDLWGFNARWLPVFLGLEQPSNRGLIAALSVCAGAVSLRFADTFDLQPPVDHCLGDGDRRAQRLRTVEHPAKTQGIHPSFPFFVRLCYVWLLAAAVLSMWAANADTNDGIGGPLATLSLWDSWRA